MTIIDFVDKINSLNRIKDDFWVGYLERLRNNNSFSWYHSSGFDLRPFNVIRELTSFGWTERIGEDYNTRFSHEYNVQQRYSKISMTDITYENIGIELQKTEFLYSDYNLHNGLLSIMKQKNSGVISNNELGKISDYFRNVEASRFLSIEPFNIFNHKQRHELAKSISKDYAKHIENQEYDGFLVKLANYNSYVTIIFFCLDDRIVKKVIDEYNLHVICVFENTAGGGEGGGLSFQEIYTSSEETKNLKYIFSDNYHLDRDSQKLYLDYDNISVDYTVRNYHFGKDEATISITDTTDSQFPSGLGFHITRSYDNNINGFRYRIDNLSMLHQTTDFNKHHLQDTIKANLILDYLFGRIHGNLKITNHTTHGPYGDGFCLAIRKYDDVFPETKMPTWLIELAQGKTNTKIDISDFLTNSCFYYCAGSDITPIVALERKVFSYVYCDNCYSHDLSNADEFFKQAKKLEDKLLKRGYKKVLEPFKLFNNWFDNWHIAYRRYYMCIFEKSGFYYCLWYIYADDASVWKNLYQTNKICPLIISNSNPENSKSAKWGFLTSNDCVPQYVIGHTYSNENYELLGSVEYLGDYGKNGNFYRRLT